MAAFGEHTAAKSLYRVGQHYGGQVLAHTKCRFNAFHHITFELHRNQSRLGESRIFDPPHKSRYDNVLQRRTTAENTRIDFGKVFGQHNGRQCLAVAKRRIADSRYGIRQIDLRQIDACIKCTRANGGNQFAKRNGSDVSVQIKRLVTNSSHRIGNNIMLSRLSARIIQQRLCVMVKQNAIHRHVKRVILRNFNRFQCATPSEGIGSDGFHRCPKENVSQRRTKIKRIFSDKTDCIRQDNGSQGGASIKRATINVCHGTSDTHR